MVRGGRGYSSRGGGRGSSYRSSGSTYTRMGGPSRKSDFHESSYRGGGSSRYTGGSSYNSYDSRNRDKFQSRYENRHEGKRSYRDSSRDRSDDRKRPRQEDSRLHSSYTSSSSTYRNRNTSRNRLSSPTKNYQSRGTASSYRQREDSASRRHASANDSMGPPKRPIRSSYVVRPRGSSTVSRVRGGGGTGIARGGMRGVIRKESTDMRIMRRKLLMARQRDRARLIKIARLTSSLRKRKGPRSSESPSGGGSKSRGDKKSDNEDEDEDDDGEEEEEEIDEDADEEQSSPGKAKEKREKKTKSKKVAAGEDGDDAENAGKEGEDEDDENEKPLKKDDGDAMDEDAPEEEDDETKEGKNKSLVKGENTAADETKDGKEASKEKKDKDSKVSRRKRSKSPMRRPNFIKLRCVHCHMNCVTFKDYNSHLYTRMHKMAMRRVAISQRVTLTRMRTEQRNAQREIEEKSKEDLEDTKVQFCLLCRLNYRQSKAKHQLSEDHKDMKKFLMPYCQTCHLAFKSPMLYEAHRCSLEHIKRKARSSEANSDEEEREVDLKNFTTVDSVGEIDDLDDEDLENHLNDDPAIANKEKVPVGSQFIKKVEAFYCELCRTYNAVKEDEEAYIKQHCCSRSHLKAFLRHREDENLQAKAERAEKKDHKKKEEATVEVEKKPEATEEADGEEVGEDKLWEDVDKDLGDLLREVGPDEHDGEEEEEEDESVLNIDIESEKSKPSKEVNGKKEETPAAGATPAEPEDKPKKEPVVTPVVKVKKEKLETKKPVKATPAAKDKEKKTEAAE